MDFQYTYSIYPQEGFYQEQGVQHVLTNQAEDTYFHGVVPTIGSGVISQPVIWPEHQGYQPQHNGFLPAIDFPVFHPIPPQGNHEMPFQVGAAPFEPWPQGPVMYVDSLGQQHGTSVVLHPELQAPLVAMGGAGPQYGVPVPGLYGAPHLQDPMTCSMDSIGQQHSFAVPLDQQLQAPFTWVDGESLPHDTSVSFNPYLQTPLDGTGQEHTAVPFNPVPVPNYEPLQFIGNPQLQWTEGLAAGFSSIRQRPSLMAELIFQLKQQETKAPTDVVVQAPYTMPTSEPLNPQVTSFKVSPEAMTALNGQLKAKIQPQVPGTSVSQDCLAVKHKSQDYHGDMEGAEAKLTGKSSSTLGELRTALITAVKAVVNLPRNLAKHEVKKRKLQNDTAEKERKEKRRKTDTSPTKKQTKSSEVEQEGPDTLKKTKSLKATGDKNNDSSKKSRGKKVTKTPIGLQPRSHLGEHMMQSVQVFHKLGDKIKKDRPSNLTPAQKCHSQSKVVYSVEPTRIPKVLDLPRQSNMLNHAPMPCYPAPKPNRPSAPVPKRQVQRPPAPVQPKPQLEVPHFFKNHGHGSVGYYGDGEVVVYLRPEYRRMFPLRLRNQSPLPPGAPRRFHCLEYSVNTTGERRADREAMKRAAKQKRDEEAKVTLSGMDCSVLADRKHLPYELWSNGDSWWETGLDDVWKFDECLEHIREDVV